ncbi:MAG TPA: HPr(Ser) kinase/phosphatase [Candidatus Binatia bacterium]|nr:HPr(Ser) kinase/phosphatase [Candidatus Binatia bacterium]
MAVTVNDVAALQGSLKLSLVAGKAGLSRVIDAPRIQKPALALAGYLDQLHPGRVQVLGNAEIGYIEGLDRESAEAAVDAVCRAPVACFVVTNGNPVPDVLRRACNRRRVPLFATDQKTAAAIRSLTRWLEDRFAPETSLHGVLIDVFGLGVLLLGKSGIGKSEAALALLGRGHRLVADDVVRVREAPPGSLLGRSPDALKHHIEIRGLGVLNVADLFGALATVDQAPVELSIEFVDEMPGARVDRLGIDERVMTILGVAVPFLQVQLRPGRDVATIVEVAARNELLKRRGVHGARRFVAGFERGLRRGVAKGTA